MCAQTTDPSPGAGEVVAALDMLSAVQQRRALLYGQFNEAYRLFVRTKAEGPYRHAMVRLTGEFQQCSQQVRALEQQLGGPLAQPQAAELLRALQERERDKLQLTLSLQALKAAHAHGKFSWQAEEAAAGGEESGGAGHVCGMGCSHEGPANEPTQGEYEAAVKESYQRLQQAITGINDVLEELQQLREELLGEDPDAAVE